MRRIAAAILLACLTAPVAAQTTPGALSRALVQAMASRDRAAAARLLKYPAIADIGGFKVPLADRAAALELYNLVFTPALRCELERGAVAGNLSGATLAGGRVRAVGEKGTLRITFIMVPGAGGAAPPPPSPPQRAFFRRGQAQFAGRLYGDGVDTYIVPGRRTGRFEARIEKFSGRKAAVRVTDPHGKVLDRPGAEAPRAWAGVMTVDGDYRVEVVRLAPYCEPPFTYLLTMTLR